MLNPTALTQNVIVHSDCYSEYIATVPGNVIGSMQLQWPDAIAFVFQLFYAMDFDVERDQIRLKLFADLELSEIVMV